MRTPSPHRTRALSALPVACLTLALTLALTRVPCPAAAAPALQPVVEIEEDVYTHTNANNGAGPMWCSGSTCLVRSGDRLFASGLETVPGLKPLNNCRWLLFSRETNGWRLVRRDSEGLTREPSPLAALPGGRILLSINPTLGRDPEPNGGPARPDLLQFDAALPTAAPRTLNPVWEGAPVSPSIPTAASPPTARRTLSSCSRTSTIRTPSGPTGIAPAAGLRRAGCAGPNAPASPGRNRSASVIPTSPSAAAPCISSASATSSNRTPPGGTPSGRDNRRTRFPRAPKTVHELFYDDAPGGLTALVDPRNAGTAPGCPQHTELRPRPPAARTDPINALFAPRSARPSTPG